MKLCFYVLNIGLHFEPVLLMLKLAIVSMS